MKKISLFLFLLLLISIIAGTASAITIGNSIETRAVLDGATNIAFIDPTLVFPTAGTLDSWDFWIKFGDPASTSEQHTQLAPQIYRYSGSGFQYELVYSQTLHIAVEAGAQGEVGLYNHGLGAFDVQAGDVVGWWFGAGGASIPFDFTNDAGDQVLWRFGVSSPVLNSINDFAPTHVGNITYREYSIAANYTPIPEPATMLLLGTGLIGLAGLRRKFKK